MAMCEKILKEHKERTEYAMRVTQANAEREMKLYEEEQQKEMVVLEEKRKWSESRDKRAEDWYMFANANSKKKVKLNNFKPGHHVREQRNNAVHGKAEGRPAGLDDSYKLDWR
eukprot:Platyproteum_vivax@DN5815_c0_g1_i4.p3